MPDFASADEHDDLHAFRESTSPLSDSRPRTPTPPPDFVLPAAAVSEAQNTQPSVEIPDANAAPADAPESSPSADPAVASAAATTATTSTAAATTATTTPFREPLQDDRPSKRRRVEDTQSASSSTPSKPSSRKRAESPPWKNAAAEGPTTILENGRRKSGRISTVHQLQQQQRQQDALALSPSPSPAPASAPASAPKRPSRAESAQSASSSSRSATVAAPASNSRRSARAAPAETQSSRSSQRNSARDSHAPARSSRRRSLSPPPPQPTRQSTRPSRPPRHAHVYTPPAAPERRPRISTRTLRGTVFVHTELPLVHPGQVPLRKRIGSSFDDYWNVGSHLPVEEGGLVTADDGPRYTDEMAAKDAQVILRIEHEVEPGGILSEQRCSLFVPETTEEPPRQWAHYDHLVKAAHNFRRLMILEQSRHRMTAKKLAEACRDEWIRRQPKSDEQLEAEARVLNISKYRIVCRSIAGMWENVRVEVNRQRLAKWEAEEQKRVKAALNEAVNKSELKLQARRTTMGDDEGSDVDGIDDIDMDDDGMNLMTDSASSGDDASEDDDDDGDEEDEMSDSADDDNDDMSSSDEDEDKADANDGDDENLTAEQLRAKYADIPEISPSTERDYDDDESVALKDGDAAALKDSNSVAPKDDDSIAIKDDDAETSDESIDMDDDLGSSDMSETGSEGGSDDDNDAEEDDDESESESCDDATSGLLGMLFGKQELKSFKQEHTPEDSQSHGMVLDSVEPEAPAVDDEVVVTPATEPATDGPVSLPVSDAPTAEGTTALDKVATNSFGDADIASPMVVDNNSDDDEVSLVPPPYSPSNPTEEVDGLQNGLGRLNGRHSRHETPVVLKTDLIQKESLKSPLATTDLKPNGVKVTASAFASLSTAAPASAPAPNAILEAAPIENPIANGTPTPQSPADITMDDAPKAVNDSAIEDIAPLTNGNIAAEDTALSANNSVEDMTQSIKDDTMDDIAPSVEMPTDSAEAPQSQALSIIDRQPDTPGSELSAQPADKVPKTEIPFLLRGNLREYQHYGLDWLAGLYANNTNGILADEMGLGKTIQTISLLAHLACHHGIWGPHLVVVPTSVMLNWEMEFKKWCPGFKIMAYYGSIEERRRKRHGWNNDDLWNVCITSYQLVLQDNQVFRRRKWHYLILDEAHNIKNFKSLRWQTLLGFNTQARLLITGTPLQNNLTELWSLLFFLMPSENGVGGFADLQEFHDWFAKPESQILESGKEQLDEEGRAIISKLHKVLRPYLLRRLKADVEKQMPAKYEHVEFCRLSKRQRELYDGFLARSDTRATLAGGNYLSIINCLMQLRKVCNHPDLFVDRPIQTSLRMDRSVPSEFVIVDKIVKRTLLAERPAASVSLCFLNLVPAANEHRSSDHARRIVELSAHDQICAYRDAQGERVKLVSATVDPTTAEASIRSLEASSRRSHLDRLKHCVYVNDFRTDNRPVYGKNLTDFLTLDLDKRPRAQRPRAAAKLMEWFENDSFLLKTAVKDVNQRAAELETTIQKFACVTPAVVTRDMPEIVLGRKGIEAFQDEDLRLSKPVRWSPFIPPEPPVDPWHEARIRLSIQFPDKRLLQYDCGKLQALDRLLRKLQAGGHRALIFTQMTRVLDILEQFLNIHGHKYLRLDGATKVEQRQLLTDRFNSDKRILCFILSTRSGGLGINLTGADTVIFYDQDWNPAMDKQCQDRCHRIGQTRDVHIYRLVSEHTIEANILRKASQKQMLDDVVIQDGSFTTDYFSRLKARERAIHDDDDPEADLQDGIAAASAAMDRVLGGSSGAGAVGHQLEQAEDREDVTAARVAEKEIHEDEADFSERASRDDSQSVRPSEAPSEQPTVASASVEADVEGDAESAEYTTDGRLVKTIDEYMVQWMEVMLLGTALEIPKDKKKTKTRKRGKDTRRR